MTSAGYRWRGGVVMALVALALLQVACTVSLPALPGQAPPPPRLVFITTDWQIVTQTLGGEPTIISPTQPADVNDPTRRRFTWPAWSPDGRRVAYLALDTGGASGAVLIAEADGANRVTVQELPNNYPIYLSWSPDGQAVAFLTSGEETLHLFLGNADGRGAARLLLSGQPVFTSWSPDSQALSVHTGGSYFSTTAGRLSIVSLDATIGPDRIDINPELFRVPAWSPAGAFQAVAGDTGDGTPALYLRDRAGSLLRFADLTGPPVLLWSPSGDRLAWSSLDGPPFAYNGIQVATPDGQTRLTAVAERLYAFYWSPDGEMLAYFTFEEAERLLLLRVAPAGGGTARTLAAFEPSREFIQYLTFFDQYTLSASIWSADSRTLTFAGWLPPADANGPSYLYAVPADGSAAATMIGPGRISFFAPASRS
ncbi:MAG: PD40 domain-containing protein [Chloroflexi bacterium]|nr:PD40 domain-containing protein [Chloroflexota bacterium]